MIHIDSYIYCPSGIFHIIYSYMAVAGSDDYSYPCHSNNVIDENLIWAVYHSHTVNSFCCQSFHAGHYDQLKIVGPSRDIGARVTPLCSVFYCL